MRARTGKDGGSACCCDRTQTEPRRGHGVAPDLLQLLLTQLNTISFLGGVAWGSSRFGVWNKPVALAVMVPTRASKSVAKISLITRDFMVLGESDGVCAQGSAHRCQRLEIKKEPLFLGPRSKLVLRQGARRVAHTRGAVKDLSSWAVKLRQALARLEHLTLHFQRPTTKVQL